MGKKGGSAPQAPDPQLTTKLQEESNLRQYERMLQDARGTSINPYGTSKWINNPATDTKAYEQALQQYMIRKNAYDQQLANARNSSTQDLGDGSGGMAPMFSEARFRRRNPAPEAPDAKAFQTNDWTFEQSFNPEMQERWDSLTGDLDQVRQSMATDGGYDPKIAQAIYDRQQFLVDPQVQLDRTRMENRLAERGFQVQNDGYRNEMDRFESGVGKVRNDASNAAVISAAGEGRANNAQRAQLAMALQQQMMGGLLGQPNSFSVPNLGGTDVMGAYNAKYQGDLNAYNAQMGSRNALMSTLGTLGGAALMMGTGGAASPWVLPAMAGGSMLLQSPGGVSGTGFRIPQ